MNGVFRNLPKGVYTLIYADDILLIGTGKHPKTVRRKLQAAFNDIAKLAVASKTPSASAPKSTSTKATDHGFGESNAVEAHAEGPRDHMRPLPKPLNLTSTG